MSRFLQCSHVHKHLSSKIPGLLYQHRHAISKTGYVNCLFDDIRHFASVSHASRQGWRYSQAKQLKTELYAIRGLLERSGLLERTLKASYNEQRRYYSNENNEDKNDEKDEEEKMQERMFRDLVSFLLPLTVLLIFTTMFLTGVRSNQVEISWADFEKELLSKGMVRGVQILKYVEETTQGSTVKEKAYIYCYPDAMFKGRPYRFPQQFYVMSNSPGMFEKKVQEFELANGISPTDKLPMNYGKADLGFGGIVLFMVLALTAAFLLRKAIAQRGLPPKNAQQQSMSDMVLDMVKEPTKLKIRRGDQMVQNLTFKDVAGLHEAKIEILEFVDYIKSPDKFKALGATVPKGALLLGPPGCGKTLLAKALAAEAKVPFFSHAGTEFVEMIGGLGASRVRQLFEDARKNSPCIIFIDEIDAIGSQRSADGGEFGGNTEEEHTLNQLLVEMDGMGTTEGVLILAATNRSDILDKALLRPGRFDRHILIDLPTATERIELFEIYLAKLKLEKPLSAYAVRLAQRTPGMSGADIANICNEAAIHAAREHKTSVTYDDFEYAVERIVAGVAKNNNTVTVAEKKITAYHESGRALVEWLSDSREKLLKVSIVPRTNARLGFSQYARPDIHLQTKEDLFQTICSLLGGRVAETLIFNKVTTGSEDELKRVTELANGMIRTYGMNNRVGQISFPTDEELRSNFRRKPFSNQLQKIMDEEVRKLISEAYKHTEEVLKQNMDKLHTLANALLEKESLEYAEVEKLIGPPPHQKFSEVDDPAQYFAN